MSFSAHVELVHFFLANRDGIVDRLAGLLNAQRKLAEYLHDSPLLSRHAEDCFFIGANADQARLRGELEEAHGARFKPRDIPGLHNGLVDPGEMMVRAFHLWQQTRWPGRNGRIRYANTLFNLTVVRALTLLSMRVWDDGDGGAGDRFSQVRALLDRLWTTSPADQAVFVRDARWLIPMAQSPATDDLGAYFAIAESVAGTLSEEDRLEIHRASVRMAGGHLRSQTRYHALKNGVPLDDRSLVVTTRTSNALDFALLVQELVPLLDAYERACRRDDAPERLDLADAICQGISSDPELLVNRVDLLGAHSMIEHLFVATDGDAPAYTPMGRRHVQLLQEYQERMRRVSGLLFEDCARFRPVPGAYSPYGLIYGFSTDLLEHMALKAVQPTAVTRFGLEDAFSGGGDAPAKLEWVRGWRQLPHLTPEVQKMFDYPQQFAEDTFSRIERALRRAASDDEAVRTGRFVLLPASEADAATHRAESYDERRLLSDRQEGKCVVSYRTPEGWAAVSKAILTEVLAEGRDATIAGLPPAAAGVLTLTCPGLVMSPDSGGA